MKCYICDTEKNTTEDYQKSGRFICNECDQLSKLEEDNFFSIEPKNFYTKDIQIDESN